MMGKKSVVILILLINALLVSAKIDDQSAMVVDYDGDGYSTDDCNDYDSAINPDAVEIEDNIDQNCRNDPPRLDISKVVVTEGYVARIQHRVVDPDGDNIILKYSSPFDHNGKWQTKIGDGGNVAGKSLEYDFYVIASDGKSETKKVSFAMINSVDTRNMWKYSKDNSFVNFVEDSPFLNPDMKLSYGKRTLTSLTSDIFMRNKRNFALDFYCVGKLEVYVNGKKQISLTNPGLNVGEFDRDNELTNIKGTRDVIKFKAGWNSLKVNCRSTGGSGNSHVDFNRRLSEVVDLMVADRARVGSLVF
jgi:hypothetical protein